MRLTPAPVRTKLTKAREVIARTRRLILFICPLILAAISNSFKNRLGESLKRRNSPPHQLLDQAYFVWRWFVRQMSYVEQKWLEPAEQLPGRPVALNLRATTEQSII